MKKPLYTSSSLSTFCYFRLAIIKTKVSQSLFKTNNHLSLRTHIGDKKEAQKECFFTVICFILVCLWHSKTIFFLPNQTPPNQYHHTTAFFILFKCCQNVSFVLNQHLFYPFVSFLNTFYIILSLTQHLLSYVFLLLWFKKSKKSIEKESKKRKKMIYLHFFFISSLFLL